MGEGGHGRSPLKLSKQAPNGKKENPRAGCRALEGDCRTYVKEASRARGPRCRADKKCSSGTFTLNADVTEKTKAILLALAVEGYGQECKLQQFLLYLAQVKKDRVDAGLTRKHLACLDLWPRTGPMAWGGTPKAPIHRFRPVPIRELDLSFVV